MKIDIKNKDTITKIILFLTTLLLYLPTFNASFVGIDDPSYVYLNQSVKQKDIYSAFTSLVVSDWTPIVTLSHIIEHALYGEINSTIAHSVNVFFHALNVILVYYLCSLLKINKKYLILIALIFACHPLQVESVSWVSSRKNLLSTLFGLLYCIYAINSKHIKALVLLACALMSKGVSVIFPVWYLLLCKKSEIGKQKLFISTSFILALIRAVVSMSFQKEVMEARPVSKMSLLERFNIFSQVHSTQLRQFFLPFDLSFRYFWKTNFSIDFYLSLALLLLLSFQILYYWNRNNLISTSLILYFVTLFPTSNIFPAPDFQADRYVYLALFPLSIFLIELFNIFSRKIIYILYVWILLTLLPVNFYRQEVWRENYNLWADVIARYPNYAYAWHRLGIYYDEKKDFKNAEYAFRRTLQIEPSNLYVKYNLGLLYKKIGRKLEAKEIFNTLIGTEVENKYPIRKLMMELN